MIQQFAPPADSATSLIAVPVALASLVLALAALLVSAPAVASEADDAQQEADAPAPLNPKADLISLHYDHAPDKDDGQSAAADRTILESTFGPKWLAKHALAVSGAYGLNKRQFNPKSDAVMDAVFNDRGGWVAAHEDRDKAVATIAARWLKTLKAGGDVWVKEGGQSDITARVVRQLVDQHKNIDTTTRIHVVQHSNWNENKTTPADLAYVKQQTDYIRIKDANAYLNVRGGNEAFEKAAMSHPVFGQSWKAAFAYYPPKQRLDFSDTGELMRILGLGEMGIDTFYETYLDQRKDG